MRHAVLKLLFALIVAPLVAGSLVPPTAAPAADLSQMFGSYAGVNATWLQGPEAGFPVDVEGTGNVKMSLSPHISATGMLAYGFANSYLRWDIDVRVTATDADNANFNVFLGVGYRDGSIDQMQPGEWAPSAGFGWVPWPESHPHFIVVGKSSTGLQSSRTITYLGGRYELPFNLFK